MAKMAARKTDERFELVEKEIKEVRVSMEKGMGDMEKGLGEVRVELSQNRMDMSKIRRLMEEQMKLLSASTSAPGKMVAAMTEGDLGLNRAGEGCEVNRAGDRGPNRAVDDREANCDGEHVGICVGEAREANRDGECAGIRVREAREANRAGERVEIRLGEERSINPRVSQNVLCPVGDFGWREQGIDRVAEGRNPRNPGRDGREDGRGLARGAPWGTQGKIGTDIVVRGVDFS